jgi:tetratricopeptide (TPR) repeat protein
VSQGLSPQVVRRLAFVRFLHAQGLEQVRRPQPFATTALLSFHDAVELFLGVAADHLGINLPQHVTFVGYFDQIEQGMGAPLPGKSPMTRMNRGRVNLKHHGLIPSAADLEQFRADVTTFLTDATQVVFSVGFTTVDMIDLVPQLDTLTLLRSAETQAAQGDYTDALGYLSQAFDDLLTDYADRKKGTGEFSSYTLWPVGMRAMFSHDRDRELNERLGKAEIALDRFQRAFRVLAMGVNYQRYARFELLVPEVIRFVDDPGYRDVRALPGLKVGDDDYQFCKQFVVETALHLAELDFDLNLYEVYMEHYQRQLAAAAGTTPGTA